jgi:hypothetical protein
MPAWSSRVAELVVWVCIVLAWTLSSLQMYSAWMAWRHGIGMYGMPGALSIVYYVPLVVVYVCAAAFANKWRFGVFAMAPVTGILALSLASVAGLP